MTFSRGTDMPRARWTARGPQKPRVLSQGTSAERQTQVHSYGRRAACSVQTHQYLLTCPASVPGIPASSTPHRQPASLCLPGGSLEQSSSGLRAGLAAKVEAPLPDPQPLPWRPHFPGALLHLPGQGLRTRRRELRLERRRAAAPRAAQPPTARSQRSSLPAREGQLAGSTARAPAPTEASCRP